MNEDHKNNEISTHLSQYIIQQTCTMNLSNQIVYTKLSLAIQK